MPEKKYVIELNEHQLRLLSFVCDQYSRLIEGQDHAFQELMESAWERRAKKATGHSMDEGWNGGWSAMRERAENVCKDIKADFWGLNWNANYGIHYDNTADIIWDMHCVIRHALWLADENPEKSIFTVDAFTAMCVGDEPLITVKAKE